MAAPTANPAIALGPGDPPLTLAEVAQHYRMPERQLRKLVREKSVEVLRYGHAVRFDRHALLSLEEALRVRQPTMMPAPSSPSVRSRESAYEKALRLTTLASRSRRTRAKQQPVNGEDKG